MMDKYCPSSWRRTSGYGAPICAFAVKRFAPDRAGWSPGPLTDWVLVDFSADGSTLAHELGHACNLWHIVDVNNLMNETATPSTPGQRRSLTGWQIAMLRASRHVTYF